MNELMNFLMGLDEETLSSLVSDFYADDGLIDCIEGDGWVITRDNFLFNKNYELPIDEYTDFGFAKKPARVQACIDRHYRLSYKYSWEDGDCSISSSHFLKDGERDDLFLKLFPTIHRQHSYLMLETMESTNDRFGNEETKKKILNNLCKKLIDKFGSEEKAVEIIKEEVDE